MPLYTDVVAEDFAGQSIYTTLDLYVSFDQRQLHEASRDMLPLPMSRRHRRRF